MEANGTERRGPGLIDRRPCATCGDSTVHVCCRANVCCWLCCETMRRESGIPQWEAEYPNKCIRCGNCGEPHVHRCCAALCLSCCMEVETWCEVCELRPGRVRPGVITPLADRPEALLCGPCWVREQNEQELLLDSSPARGAWWWVRQALALAAILAAGLAAWFLSSWVPA